MAKVLDGVQAAGWCVALFGATAGALASAASGDWSDATLNGALLCWIVIAGFQELQIRRLKRTAGEGRSPDYELTRDGVTTRLWVRRR